MRASGRIAAAIEVLAEIEDRRRPAKLVLKDWGHAHRFAGSKDRAWISGLVLDSLRKKRSLAWMMGAGAAPSGGDGGSMSRAIVLGCLRVSWGWDVDTIAQAVAEEPHGPGALTDAEGERLTAPVALGDAPLAVQADIPDWLEAELTRVFGDDVAAEGQALATRAPVDLRVNTLKSDADRVVKALSSVGAGSSGVMHTALRIPAPAPGERAGHVESIPVYNKGWVEIQDLGSQIAAAAAGDVVGAQVLDYCAGGGGKTLALAAQSEGRGQVYAYDADARRLAPIFDRCRRAGTRTVQIRSPQVRSPGEGGDGVLDDLRGKMDVVFVDAPCTGSGVWRRQPDAKWRLSDTALAQRMGEQDQILATASTFVKPGGRLVYVTCSLFACENEDRLAAFLAANGSFQPISAADSVQDSGLLTADGAASLDTWRTDVASPGAGPGAGSGVGLALRLSPKRSDTDGFFVAVLRRGQ